MKASFRSIIHFVLAAILMAMLAAPGAFAQDPQFDSDLMDSLRNLEFIDLQTQDMPLPDTQNIQNVSDFEGRRATLADRQGDVNYWVDRTVQEIDRLNELEARATTATQVESVNFQKYIANGLIQRLGGFLDEISNRAYAFDALHLILEDAGNWAQQVYSARQRLQFRADQVAMEVINTFPRESGPCLVTYWWFFAGGRSMYNELLWTREDIDATYEDIAQGEPTSYDGADWIRDAVLYDNPLYDIQHMREELSELIGLITMAAEAEAYTCGGIPPDADPNPF
jgi:hypothetical protein